MKKVAVVWSSPNPDGLTAGHAPLPALPRVQEQNSIDPNGFLGDEIL